MARTISNFRNMALLGWFAAHDRIGMCHGKPCMQKFLLSLVALASLAIATALGFMAWQGMGERGVPALTTPYQAVALANGQVFFGRLDGHSSSYLVLRDVFYIQSRQNPDTKEVANILVKRGGEAHGPDRMVLNRQQVTLIEPVTEGSRIAKLIAEQTPAQ